MQSLTVSERFHDSYITEPNSGCWIWTKATTNGYGVMQVGLWKSSKLRQAHRVSVELNKGISLSRSEVVCHKCDNPICVNPQHLFIGTHADNVQDKIKKGRFILNGKVHRKYLTAEDVSEIRMRISTGEKQGTIADSIGCDPSVISRIKNNETWRLA